MTQTSLRFECLDLVFSVHAADPGLQALIAELYAPCSTEREPAIDFAVEGGETGSSYAVCRGAATVRTTDDPSVALAHLVWEIGQAVVRASARTGRLLLHAGAVASDHRAVLLPAASGSGKSMLTAALVSSGLRYLTDDVAAIEATTGMVLPYPKPIAVPLRLRRKLPRAGPLPSGRFAYLGDEGFVTARELGAATGGPTTPGLIVHPQYRPGSPTRATALSPAQGVQLLAEQSFHLPPDPAGALEELAAISAGCRRLTLVYSDLDEAVTLIGRELELAVRA